LLAHSEHTVSTFCYPLTEKPERLRAKKRASEQSDEKRCEEVNVLRAEMHASRQPRRIRGREREREKRNFCLIATHLAARSEFVQGFLVF
jgi:hypothetical protein